MSLLRTPSGYVDPWTRTPVDPSAIAPLPAMPPAPVIRRPATSEELARLEGDARRQIPAYPSHHELAVVRANREAEREARRIARETARQALAAAKRPTGRPPMLPLDVVIDAVRASGGNRKAAARALGLRDSAVYHRLARNPIPEDVAALVAGRRRGA